MKVLHVITGLNDGGAEAVLYRLVTRDQNDTHHVVSLTGLGKYGPWLLDQGVTVTALDMPRGRLTMRGLCTLWQTVRSERPAVIQTWMYHADLLGGLVGRLVGVPVVWGIHNTLLEAGKSSRNTIFVARLSAVLSGQVPRVIVYCSDAAWFAHESMGYKPKRIAIIDNGIDTVYFSPDLEKRLYLRKLWGVPVGVPVLGMVARFDPYKDHENLFEALGALKQRGVDFRLALVGQDMDLSNALLCEWRQRHGLADKVLLLGPTLDVPGVMSALDVHVLSSSAESFGNVVAEAMACGTPCVATDVGAIRKIIGDTGWVVPSRDSEALAQGIQQALAAMKDVVRWRDRQIRCRARIEREFGVQRMVEHYRAVWQEAAKCVA
jgi:glycosyltransferase involved in cell wall biosynthesis